jgi:transcriptional regulator NrdR family protein
MYCPECKSQDVESIGESEEVTDGQGYYWTVSTNYVCNECGCTFERIETTEVTYDIYKHGKVKE